jgi:regulator of sigma E protease
MHHLVKQAVDQDNTHHDTVPVTLIIQRAGSTAPITVIVHARAHPTPEEGYLGVGQKILLVSTPFWQAPFQGLVLTFNTMGTIIVAFGQMLRGLLPFQLSGPVGISKITSDAAQAVAYVGWWPLLSLTAILSLNLAIFNILPFPALDGGRVFLILVELLRGGKRLHPKYEGFINFVGMAALLTLMIVVTYFDLHHWSS